MTRMITGALAALALLLLVAVVLIYSGTVNVAASEPHTGPVRWALDTTMHASVRSGAESIDAPPQFEQQQVEQGFRSYEAMCVHCHGAPGVEHADWAKGMRPRPPSLSAEASQWSPAELYWIVKHGIRMTAMPAFGEGHDDAALWSIVAFIRQLPSMKDHEYAALRSRFGGSGGHHGGSGSGSGSGSNGSGSGAGSHGG